MYTNMARQIFNVEYSIPEEGSPPYRDLPLHEVPRNHPLRRYTAAMARKLEIPPPPLYLTNDPTVQGFAYQNFYYPYIVLGESILAECSNRTIAFILAHEVGHLTPENKLQTNYHPAEFMADAAADIVLPHGVAVQGLVGLMRHIPLPQKLRRWTGKTSHPSMGRRVWAIASKAWHETCLKSINRRHGYRMDLESRNRAIAELRRRTAQQKPNPHHEERAFRLAQQRAETQSR